MALPGDVSMTRTLVTLLAVAGLFGCTTLQPLPDAQPATLQQSVKPGDRVEIERLDGTRLTLKVEKVGADTLTGVHDGKRLDVPIADIRTIGTRAMTTQSKIWTAVGVIGAIGAAIAISDGGGSGGGDGY
jgi:hypothetical protein